MLELPPNRARRNYRGGKLLDLWEGLPTGQDGDQPEDWLASTTTASNPGLPPIADEGLATIEMDGRHVKVADLFAEDPAYWLGDNHVRKIGVQLGFLVKLLDSAMRLHVQAHPTREFAREHLNSRWGKLETYVILTVREGVEPFIRLGFQRAPSPAEWRRIVLEQDIAAMDACFERVPVERGEVWFIPGGLPHAIGSGLLVLETLEPTDLVVRCEFEREGIVVPPDARFMGRDPDFALKVFDMNSRSVEDVTKQYRIEPRIVRSDIACRVEELIGPELTDCFAIQRLVAIKPYCHRKSPLVHIGVVTRGEGELHVRGDRIHMRQGTRFLLPAAAEQIEIEPADANDVEIILVRPGGG